MQWQQSLGFSGHRSNDYLIYGAQVFEWYTTCKAPSCVSSSRGSGSQSVMSPSESYSCTTEGTETTTTGKGDTPSHRHDKATVQNRLQNCTMPLGVFVTDDTNKRRCTFRCSNCDK